MKPITPAKLRALLKREKQHLHSCRARDFEANRARSSSATEDALSRVIMLEELCALSEPDPPAPDDSLDL